MSKNILFSVSMCVYGGDNPVWFEEAVNSVLTQTIMPAEIVLVVDGPLPTEMDQIVSRYEKDPLFVVVRLAENQGHGKARQCGLQHCQYDWIALMDADDICVPDRFEQQMKHISTNEVDIVGGDIAEFIGSPENIVSYRTVLEKDEDIKQDMKRRCPFNQVTVMFRKKIVEDVGGYLDWHCEEDYYLWLRMMLFGCQMANTGTVLVHVRVGEEMYQRRGGLKYFKSEAKLQKYMLDHKIIGFFTYLVNVSKRLIVQVFLPPRIRGWVFKTFARKTKCK